jgi:serpin B
MTHHSFVFHLFRSRRKGYNNIGRSTRGFVKEGGCAMTKKLKILLLVCIVVSFTQCTDRSLSPAEQAEEATTDLREHHSGDASLLMSGELAALDNEFGFRLLGKIASNHPDDNIIISPLSISMALGMAVNGAAGPTREAMLQTLGLDGHSIDMVNTCYRNVIDHLVGRDPRADFEIANSVWCRDGVLFEEPFLEACQTSFDAEIRSLDFTDPGAADTINAWVAEKTLGYIPEIVASPLAPDLVAILLNALNFWGTWRYRFDPELTHDGWFNRSDGSQVLCRMMQRPDDVPGVDRPGCRYTHMMTWDFQAVELPYGDSLFSMVIFKPWMGTDIEELVAMLDQDLWQQVMTNDCWTYGQVIMPRFELESGYNLNDVLTALGMGIAFSSGSADFSGICCDIPLWISEVKHRTYVRVDEGGVIASGVTDVDISTGILPCPEYFTMHMNSPFVFVIRENIWGTILFLGRVMDPGYLP